eukprot:752184-Hanusia_phi.AAC.2
MYFTAYGRPKQDFFLDNERLNGRESSLSFGIGLPTERAQRISHGAGGSGSGVPFHVHGPGFSEVLWGRKRWFLMPEGIRPDFDPDETTSSSSMPLIVIDPILG